MIPSPLLKDWGEVSDTSSSIIPTDHFIKACISSETPHPIHIEINCICGKCLSWMEYAVLKVLGTSRTMIKSKNSNPQCFLDDAKFAKSNESWQSHTSNLNTSLTSLCVQKHLLKYQLLSFFCFPDTIHVFLISQTCQNTYIVVFREPMADDINQGAS